MCRERYAEAEEFFTAAIELDGQNSLAYSGRSVIYTRQGKFEQALADLNKFVSLEPKVWDGYFERGVIQIGRAHV